MDLTRDWLMEAAGWKAVREGKALCEKGAASGVKFDGKMLRGMVLQGRKKQQAGLVIAGPDEVTNICNCQESRQKGIICAHSAACVLAFIDDQAAAEAEAAAIQKAKEAATKKRAARQRLAGSSSGSGAGSGKGGALPAVGAADRGTGASGNGDNGSGAADAETIDVHRVEFPPNFVRAWEKGEAVIKIVPTTLDTSEMMATEGAHQSPDDASALLDWLGEKGLDEIPPLLGLNARQLPEFLKQMATYPHCYFQGKPLRIAARGMKLAVLVEPLGDDEVFFQVDKNSQVERCGQEDGDSAGWLLVSQGEGGNFLAPVTQPSKPMMSQLGGLFRQGEDRCSLRWFLSHLSELEEVLRFESTEFIDDLELVPGKPRIELDLEGNLNSLSARLGFTYDEITLKGRDILLETDETAQFPYTLPDAPLTFHTRNREMELAAIDRLNRAHFSAPDADGVMHMRSERLVLPFFASLLPELKKIWDVRVGNRFEESTADLEVVRPELDFDEVQGSGEDWLAYEVTFASESGSTVPMAEIQRLFRTGQTSLAQENGKRLVADLGAVAEFNAVMEEVSSSKDGRLSAAEAGFLSVAMGGRESNPTDSRLLPTMEQAIEDCPWDDLGDLANLLRPYQREGVAWLFSRRSVGKGAILADEMGLGKTFQSLSFLSLLDAHQDKSTKRPSLIICPTSLVGNWLQEAKRWVPHLNVLVMQGGKRKRYFEVMETADLIITSYALIYRDLDQYQAMGCDAVVLDEASYIKNARAQAAQAVKELNFNYALALTGTPIENSVRDLHSIMEFVSPGYLGSREQFKYRYEKPIQAERPDPAIQKRLRNKLSPFLLRRTKKVVAKDLPDKLEQVVRVALTPLQMEVYHKVLQAAQDEVANAIKTKGAEKARMTMLTSLLRLRQVCCHLKLLNMNQTTDQGASAKVEVLRDHLNMVREGGHRVLIFSQFVSMLSILRKELEAASMPYAYLDGSSQNRAEEVARFQADDSVTAFLISLKAGGYGLTLTKADTVIHFDPWWNPAVEAQATDRAHRIGQTRTVTAYKYICEDTVEEKILNLQRRKRSVIDAALDDEQPLMQGLELKDLKELMEMT